jgi:hypothetical protein
MRHGFGIGGAQMHVVPGEVAHLTVSFLPRWLLRADVRPNGRAAKRQRRDFPEMLCRFVYLAVTTAFAIATP